MTVPASALYVGTLRHRRFVTADHAFSYSVFMACLDIDRLPELMAASRFTSYNRWNWATFDERDHLGDPRRPLRERLAQDAEAHGVEWPGGPVFLLTNLRYLGFCFNPVSFFYCFDTRGTLALVLAEVNNTFGGSHRYWLRPAGDSTTFRAACEKSLYVSPFVETPLAYRFAFTPPGERLAAHIDVLDGDRRVLDATLSLERRPWTPRDIRRTLAAFPWMTAKVVAAIHWQAVRLWLKGVPIVRRRTADGVGERDAFDRAMVTGR